MEDNSESTSKNNYRKVKEKILRLKKEEKIHMDEYEKLLKLSYQLQNSYTALHFFAALGVILIASVFIHAAAGGILVMACVYLVASKSTESKGYYNQSMEALSRAQVIDAKIEKLLSELPLDQKEKIEIKIDEKFSDV
jgi:hypothetical protein